MMTPGVAFLPVYHNPYQHLLSAALRESGIDVTYLQEMPTFGWLRSKRDDIQVLHLHWLYGLYMARLWTPVRYGLFLARYHYARRLGYGIVWTAHNILPHRMPFPPLHYYVRRLFMETADGVVAHCQYGRAELLRRFPRQKPIYVIPHGNYDGVHPITMSRQEAREQLQIEAERFVYLFLGNLSVYKGIDRFIDAFLEVAGPRDVALVAGRNRAASDVERLLAVAGADERFRVYPGFIPEDVMQRYLLAGDVMVFAFDQILTSGSVILGMTHGLPIIAPALGCLPELVSPDAGILYDPRENSSLGSAMRAIRERNTVEMGRRARAIAAELDWRVIGQQTAEIYRTVVNR